ncbi:PQQ-dependent sugar dehydrogenase [Patescibacteria group bacterium]|nr:PQQ-dependent sugar dehydrogenase [Patescibacteria group bacterium]
MNVKNLIMGIVIALVLIMGGVFLFNNTTRSDKADNSTSDNIGDEKQADFEAILNNTQIKVGDGKSDVLPTINLVPRIIIFEDGTEVMFEVAEDFNISVAAEGLGKARFMAMSPDGRMFVPDLVSMNLSHEGKIYVLENFDEINKRFQTKSTYLSGLRGPNSVAFYTDKNGQEWIYIALTAHIVRYPYSAGDTEPSGDPEIITTFPNKQVPGESSVVWHITRTIKFYDNRLYVSVGSGCNACEQPEDEMRAMIYSINPDGGNKRIYADGLRNTVGFTWAGRELYATANGADHLGPQAPDDGMYKLIEGEYYGWPFCYELNGKIYPDTSRKWTQSFSCAQVPRSFSAFEPHAAPLGIEYFSKDAHSVLKNTFLVALHGSFEPKIGAGYHIVRVSKDGEQEVFMDGFLTEKRPQTGWLISTAYAHSDQPTGDIERFGRPVDILQNDVNSFFFTDDYKGRVYYVYAP